MQGMTPEQFDEHVRYDLASQQIADSIQSSAFTPKSVVQHLSDLIGQQRDVQGLAFRAADYAAKVHPTDAELKQYYDAHQADFRTPETATIQYVTLAASSLAAGSTPSDADLKKYYQDNIAHYRTAEEIRASHILIASPASASAADRAKAKQKAETLLAEVKAHPDQFAAIAKQNSQDPGSAEKGGDLGYFGQGMMVKPFEDAAFKLKKGEISDVVQSDFGYHIIEVTDIKPVTTKPFDDVKGEITTAVKNQQAAKLFADDADAFTNMVYEQADSLQPAADKFKLQIQTATVSRTPNPAAAQNGPLNNPKFLAAVFADDTLKNKHNTAAVDLGNNTLVSARVTQYQPAAIQPFDTVKQQVQQKVSAAQSAALAIKEGQQKLEALQKSKAADGFSAAIKVSRNAAQGLPPAAIAAIFKVDSQKLPGYVGVDLGDGGYAIYRVNAVQAGVPATPEQLAAADQQLSQVSAQTDVSAYLDELRARSKVKYYGTPPAETTDE
jgi:peptidyl-prolyl cis-trans isomerase D